MMTATIAAEKMQAERGYVVIGYPGKDRGSASIGMRVRKFAGSLLGEGLALRIDQVTDRADWEAQCIAIFGSAKKGCSGDNAPSDGEEMFRCALVRDEGATV